MRSAHRLRRAICIGAMGLAFGPASLPAQDEVHSITCPTYTTIGFLSSPWYFKEGYWFSFEWKNTTPNLGLSVVDVSQNARRGGQSSST